MIAVIMTWHITVPGMLAGEAVPVVDMALFTTQTVVMSVAALAIVVVTGGRLGNRPLTAH